MGHISPISDINIKKWKTVKVPKGLSERIDEFVKSPEAYHLGLTSNSQVVAHAIRWFLAGGDTSSVLKVLKIQRELDKDPNLKYSRTAGEHKPIR